MGGAILAGISVKQLLLLLLLVMVVLVVVLALRG